MMAVEVRKNVELLPRLKPAAEEGLYRIAQEALHNIVKHAKAKKATVYIEVKETGVTLTVVDDGVGFDPEQVAAGHMGLGTMGQRAEQLGGEYEVRSKVGQGTTVRVRIPLQRWQV
jgi:signal transduction histidine kinase